MLSAFASAFRTPDLRKKLLFTLAIIALYRLGASVPTPNTDTKAINDCLAGATQDRAEIVPDGCIRLQRQPSVGGNDVVGRRAR